MKFMRPESELFNGLMLRGRDWYCAPGVARRANDALRAPYLRAGFLGFRVVCVAR